MTRAGMTCGIGVAICLILAAAAGGDVLTIPIDYSGINEAIAAANEGDTVFVEPGDYAEQVVVDKTLSVVGRNRNVTVIDGSTGNEKAVTLTADGGHAWLATYLNDSCASGQTTRPHGMHVAPNSGHIWDDEPSRWYDSLHLAGFHGTDDTTDQRCASKRLTSMVTESVLT